MDVVQSTTRGGEFLLSRPSPAPIPIYTARGFDFGALLQESFAREPDDTTAPPPDGALGLDLEPSLATLLSPPVSLTTPGVSPQPADEGHCVAGQSRHNAQRRHKRAAAKAAHGHMPQPRTYEKYVRTAQPIFSPLNAANLRSQVGAYGAVAAKSVPGDRKKWDLDSLQAEGLTVIPWNGVDPHAVVDDVGRVLVVMAGQPRGASYSNAAVRAYSLLDSMRSSLPITDHRRGHFPVINAGILHQQGTKHPVPMNHGRPELVDALLKEPSFIQLANFASASYQLWGGTVFNHFKDRLDRLYAHFDLHRNFERSIYPAAAFNFGPHAWTYRHRDVLNSPYGWCAVQALGDFDASKGGHLVLWELKMVIEFPAGACILLPSATITHSNVPVQSGDSRASFTQYVPGGLLRFVDNGMRLQSEFEAQDPIGYAAMCEKKSSRWMEGLDMLSSWSDIVKQWGS